MPRKHLFLTFTHYSLPYPSHQANFLYKPSLFSFKLFFQEAHIKEGKESWSGGDLQCWHESQLESVMEPQFRVERTTWFVCCCVFVFVFLLDLMQATIAKFALFEMSGFSSQLYFWFKRLCKKKNLYSFSKSYEMNKCQHFNSYECLVWVLKKNK